MLLIRSRYILSFLRGNVHDRDTRGYDVIMVSCLFYTNSSTREINFRRAIYPIAEHACHFVYLVVVLGCYVEIGHTQLFLNLIFTYVKNKEQIGVPPFWSSYICDTVKATKICWKNSECKNANK